MKKIVSSFVLSASLSLVGFSCAEKVGGSGSVEEAAKNGPAAALTVVLNAARDGDEERFKNGLSQNFLAVIAEYQKFANGREDIKGAFDFRVFMKDLIIFEPIPKEEIIKGDKAIVKATRKGGGEVQTRMVKENGLWKMEVPPNMAKQLEHIDEIAQMATGEKVAERPNIGVGGGGKADRVKNLPPTATQAERDRAMALDAFDLGDLTGATKRFEALIKTNANDEDVVVALGRAYVQQNEGQKAVTLFENFLKTNPKAVPVYHYAGMAYMMQNRPADAAASWKKVITLDSAYGEKYRLKTRVKAAEQIAASATLPPPAQKGPASAPASRAASQPAP